MNQVFIYDANAYLRQNLNRLDPTGVNPRFVYEAARASTVPQIWVWDGARNNEKRRAIFPGYKVRDYTGQEDIFAGLQLYRELLALSPATQIEVPDWEADDVCGTLAKHFARQGVRSVIHTNDFDFYQLTVNPLITLKGVSIKDGVKPHLIPLFKALVGDKSDKIPGIPGFGEGRYDDLAGIHDILDGSLRTGDWATFRNQPWKPKVKAWLADDANMQQIRDFYTITTMMDVPLDEIERHSMPGKPDQQAAQAIFLRFML